MVLMNIWFQPLIPTICRIERQWKRPFAGFHRQLVVINLSDTFYSLPKPCSVQALYPSVHYSWLNCLYFITPCSHCSYFTRIDSYNTYYFYQETSGTFWRFRYYTVLSIGLDVLNTWVNTPKHIILMVGTMKFVQFRFLGQRDEYITGFECTKRSRDWWKDVPSQYNIMCPSNIRPTTNVICHRWCISRILSQSSDCFQSHFISFPSDHPTSPLPPPDPQKSVRFERTAGVVFRSSIFPSPLS